MAVNLLKKQRRTGPGRPFEKGQSGNPAGRPPGSRNAATLLAEALIEGDAEAISDKVRTMALAGHPAMLKLAYETVVPRRARTRPFALPEINSAADLGPAMKAIARAVAEGAITPFDAAELARMVQIMLHAFETGEFDRRLAALERQIEVSGAIDGAIDGAEETADASPA
jgi:hypothetical protein